MLRRHANISAAGHCGPVVRPPLQCPTNLLPFIAVQSDDQYRVHFREGGLQQRMPKAWFVKTAVHFGNWEFHYRNPVLADQKLVKFSGMNWARVRRGNEDPLCVRDSVVINTARSRVEMDEPSRQRLLYWSSAAHSERLMIFCLR